MARQSKRLRKDQLWVSVDACRIRVQTGEPIVFVDARKDKDRAASTTQIAGSIRLPADKGSIRPPCHKNNYIVVYCA
jgi:hypothetical protein